MRLKRVLDLTFSLVSVIIFIPVYFIVGLLVYFKLGLPIFFVQERVGKNGNIFKMYKFRTMLNSKDKDGNLLSDEERLTRFGSILRSTSIDELPELFNVIKGEMSLIGPRPLLVDYLSLYSKRQMKRHDVLPGLSGWAQVNGRNSITWSQKLELDVWYVENWSLWLDVKIMLMTIFKVIKRQGVSQQGVMTVERFNGMN